MNYFEKRNELLKKPDSQKTIKIFNNIAATLLQFEIVYVEAWKRQVDSVRSGKFLTKWFSSFQFLLYHFYVK